MSCPHCGSETILLAELAEAAAPAEEITAAELKEALSGVLPRSRISIFYQAGLLLVAIFMILLPIAYVGVAALAAYGVYWYASHGRVFFSNFIGGIYVLIFKAILYLAPIIGGTVGVFFMFKPIFARPRKQAPPVELNPAEHPRLYQFIAHIGDLLRVRVPKRIYLDGNLNASAGFRRGWLSLLGNDLVLTLGLPLVGGLNTRQLAALVAHELGHCTQALAMRLGYIIDSIDRWFLRVVYERDSWDDSFDEWVNSVEDWRLSIITGCAQFSIWVSRLVLGLFMRVGHAASCFLSRQMEFHADSCAMAVAGSQGVESLLLRSREQSVIEQMSYAVLVTAWKRRHQMPDNLPGFLEEFERRLPPDFYEKARLTLLNEKAGLFATHPTAAQRIQKARRKAVAGLFVMEKPARCLFKDFETTARFVTARHYRYNLRMAVTDPMLKPVREFFRQEGLAGSEPKTIPLKTYKVPFGGTKSS